MAIRTVTIGPRAGTDWDKATFGIGIGARQPVGDDLTPHYMVRKRGALVEALANAKTPPSGAPLYIDIRKSSNQGVTWTSVFPTGLASKIVIPDGSSHQVRVTRFAAAPQDSVLVDDWLRIDLLEGSAENAQDIEIVLRWSPA